MVKLLAFPGHEQFVFSSPLYATYPVDHQILTALFVGELNIDGHCVQCGRPSNFHRDATMMSIFDIVKPNDFAFCDALRFVCSRDNAHIVTCFVDINKGAIRKVGQVPSFADIAWAEDRELLKQLSDIDRREFTKATGLAAHDTGIGAFVYMRRIFERLIKQRFEINREREGWLDEQFRGMPMTEKIKFLRKYLPPFMVENSAIYSVVSKGVHELEEDECITFFPVLRGATLLILKQDKALKDEKAEEFRLKGAITEFNRRIKAIK